MCNIYPGNNPEHGRVAQRRKMGGEGDGDEEGGGVKKKCRMVVSKICERERDGFRGGGER